MGGNTFSSEPQHPDFPIVNHPKFKDSKYIQDNDAIRSTITIEHESDFQLWQQKLNKTSNIDDEVILLPKAFRYEKKAICGSSCVIQVQLSKYYRLIMITIHIFWQINYKTEDKLKNIFQNHKFGIYFTHQSLLLMIFKNQVKGLEM